MKIELSRSQTELIISYLSISVKNTAIYYRDKKSGLSAKDVTNLLEAETLKKIIETLKG